MERREAGRGARVPHRGLGRREGADVGRSTRPTSIRRRSGRCCTTSTAGPHSTWGDNFHFRWNNHAFAAQGYVVVCVNYHGSSSFGQKFMESIDGELGKRELVDVEAGTDFMLKQGYIDRDRLVAAGGSYGGYMVAWMNGHTDRYKAYVCHAGCFDWVAMFADDAWYWHPEGAGRELLGDMKRVDAQNPRALREAHEDADARDPRAARLPRARRAGARVLQHAQGEGRARRAWCSSPTRTTGSSSRRTRASGIASSSRGSSASSNPAGASAAGGLEQVERDPEDHAHHRR